MSPLSDAGASQFEKFLGGFKTTWEGHAFQAGPWLDSFCAYSPQPCALTRLVTDFPRGPVHKTTSVAPRGRCVNTTACHLEAHGSSPFYWGLSLKFKCRSFRFGTGLAQRKLGSWKGGSMGLQLTEPPSLEPAACSGKAGGALLPSGSS